MITRKIIIKSKNSMENLINSLEGVLELTQDSTIKVMGVGGGGCNAVNYLYHQGVPDVTFLVCNTDKQSLERSSVPAKLQLGPGLGAGGKPEVAQEYAEQNRERIKEALNDGTKMLFLTAGMGGGTGTGASSIVASVAREMGILTVGIVTIPFAFEGPKKIKKAMVGVAHLAEQVDAILVINNEKLREIYPDLNMLNAFSKSDDVVANAARAIAEIITVPGYINTDFADVYNTLKSGNVAIMSVGKANGENRITNAIHDALHSPLINTDVHGATRLLLQIYTSTEYAVVMSEMSQIHEFVNEIGDDVEVQWGASLDETLDDHVRVTIIATGFEVSNIPGLDDAVGKKSVDEAIKDFYGEDPATPTTHNTPTEASAPVLDGDVRLEIVGAESNAEEVMPAPQAPIVHEEGDLILNFDGEDTRKTDGSENRSVFAGWMRGRK
jgi:cell division protein FtsZ